MLDELRKAKQNLRHLSEQGKAPFAFRPKMKKYSLFVAVILFILSTFLMLRLFVFRNQQPEKPVSIAVISFENQTGNSAYDYLQDAIPNLLITGLEQSPTLQVATWERLYDLQKQLGKENIKVIDKETGFELCAFDGIDAIVLGSFVKAGDTFATDVKVLDVKTKILLKSSKAF
jgi:TolB-like protein